MAVWDRLNLYAGIPVGGRSDHKDHKHSNPAGNSAAAAAVSEASKRRRSPVAGCSDRDERELFAGQDHEAPSSKKVGLKRCRNFVFTLNFGDDTTKEFAADYAQRLIDRWLNDKDNNSARIKRCAFQVERAARVHLQGCIGLHRDSSFDIVRNLFGGDYIPWIQQSRDFSAAWEYSTKADTRVAGPYIKGSKPAQGKRTDLLDFVEAAKGDYSEGKMTLKDMQDDFIPIEARYMKYFDRVITRHTPDRNFKTRCVFIRGPPGVGKSYTARKESTNVYGCVPYALPLKEFASTQQWWDGYVGQATVLIDEAYPKCMSVQSFNSLIDEGPHQVQVKGAMVKFTSKCVFVTSNYQLAEIFDGLGHFESIMRRVDELWSVEPHAEHCLNADCSNASDVASFALWTQIK